MTVDLLERGSDPVARAGGRASVVAEVEGYDDGTVERVAIALRLNRDRTWPLGEVPAIAGSHRLAVELPVGLPPSSVLTQYEFLGTVRRTRGMEIDGVSPVHVISRAEDLFWPDGPRRTGGGIVLDVETAVLGGPLRGRAAPGAAVEVGTEVGSGFVVVARATAGPDGAFAVELPAGPPPSLSDGAGLTVVWAVRAGEDRHVVGVLDPDGLSTPAALRAAGLLEAFSRG